MVSSLLWSMTQRAGSNPCSFNTSMVRSVPGRLSRCGVWIMIGSSNSLASSICARSALSSSGGLLVVAEFAHGDDALLGQEARQHVDHRLGQRLVVGFLRIETDRAVVADAELAGAKPLEARDHGEIIDEAADIGARLAEPERGLDHRDHAGPGHRLVVVGGARDHVGVRVDDHAGIGAPADRCAVRLARIAACPGASRCTSLEQAGELFGRQLPVAAGAGQRRAGRAVLQESRNRTRMR